MSAPLPLDRWETLDFDPGRGGADAPGDWMPVRAPGDVYQALIAAGRLDHPYQGRAEDAAAWVRDREWWWRTTFVAPEVAPGERIEVAFDGLDTFAAIHLDGALVGETDNMFRAYTFDLTDRVTPGRWHVLAIRFDPPALAAPALDLPVWTAFTDRVSRSRRNMMRKAQFGWGWDWGPDLPTVGVWRAARVETRPTARIGDLAVRTLTVTPERASVSITVALQDAGSDHRLDIVLSDPQGRVVFRADRPGAHAVDLIDPQLWWTADQGDQPLYELSVRLLDGARVLDQVHRRVGVRTIEIDQSPDPDEPGATFFRFVLNGRPIFAKGACWVPATSFVGDTESEPYDRLIDQAVRANMNMIRVWGGGIYEPDVFYDLCDRRGLLVWQDFMFACAQYPESGAFAASVAAEVEHQVRRLRHHPSIAVWCGNNENQAIHRINDDKNGVASPLSGQALYDDLFPRLLADLDPTTPYWPGSPWGGPNPNSMRAGDVHDWTVWHGVPPIPDDVMTDDFRADPEGVSYRRYADDTARFVSEFGIQAAPALATLERWMDPGDLSPESEGFLARIKDHARKADAMMEPVTGPPTTLADYVDFTQWTQAEGLKFGIEHFRRRRPHCSGALLWQFNDCWPCVSWSLVDYDGAEKAGYHAVRRAFSPVLASFKERDDGQVELWITNDTLQPVSGEATLAQLTTGGGQDWLQTVRYDAPPGGHHMAWRGPAPHGDDRVLRVWSDTGTFEANRLLSAPIKGLRLTPARPDMTMARIGPNTLRITLTAPAYLPFVHLTTDRPDLRFSDNHFDLAPGEARTVTVTGAVAFGPDDLTVRCWNDRQSLIG